MNRCIRPFFVCVALVAINSATALAGGDKVDICHANDAGVLSIKNVSVNAFPGHERHGDWMVTQEVCDDGYDNDCDGEVDEDCQVCPCFTADQIVALVSGYPDQHICSTAEHSSSYDVAVTGLSAQDFTAGTMFFAYAAWQRVGGEPGCVLDDRGAGTYFNVDGLSEEDLATCRAIVADAAATLGLTCATLD